MRPARSTESGRQQHAAGTLSSAKRSAHVRNERRKTVIETRTVRGDKRPCAAHGEKVTLMQHVHAKHEIVRNYLSDVLRSLTLSDWTFFLEFQQNSRIATRIASASPQSSTTKTPPGMRKPEARYFTASGCRRFFSDVARASHASELMYLPPGTVPWNLFIQPLPTRPSQPFASLSSRLFICPPV